LPIFHEYILTAEQQSWVLLGLQICIRHNNQYETVRGYSVNLGSRCLICFSHFSVRCSYSLPAILWEHIFSTAWYNSSRLYDIQLQLWMADTASSSLTRVCSSNPFGKFGFTAKYSTKDVTLVTLSALS